MNEVKDILGTDSEFQKWLKGVLREGVTTITFTKKNGDERVMKCTLNEEYLPSIEKEASEISEVRQTSNTSLSVFDIEVNGWRSFRWDSVKGVNFNLGEE